MGGALNSQVVRFALIGVANTLIDFGIFHLLANELTQPFFFANIVSTSTALIFSFIMNSRFTFKNQVTRQNLVKFFVVTLSALWLLQPLVIAIILPLISLFGNFLSAESQLLIAKVVATGASLVWNFVLYKFYVYK